VTRGAVAMRPATASETPTLALRLAQAARAAGWECKLSYACGTAREGGVLTDTAVVRLRRGHRMAVGTWTAGTWTDGRAWNAAHGGYAASGYTQLSLSALIDRVGSTDA
jgi:hypothetical protein